MGLRALVLGAAAAALVATGLPASARVTDPKPSAPSAAAPAAQAPGAHVLDAQDVNVWLDGFMPQALSAGDIAGAVVVVVKDGQVVTQRGFGVSDMATRAPVDPAKTLFRIGSVSKLLTWTAVMQQVEAGKLDLDADVNTYLDFRIPPRDGKPITLRNLMTHTAGFEEHAKNLFVPTATNMMSVEAYLKSWVPTRIYAPGTVPAYSNYGATLAGYIVQRVSGEEFNAYVDHHILQPLAMSGTTFAQPVPAGWGPNLSKGYYKASSGEARPFEVIPAAPAGSVSTTGADMARFMSAHLAGGTLGSAQILKPETAALMHAPAFAGTPPLPGMALGFYHEDRNGHVIVGHAGDTETFHSDLHLFLDDGVGLFVSFNSLGAGGGSHTARTELFRSFADRYFPTQAMQKPTLASAKHDAAVVAGTYINSRRNETSFLRLLSLIGPVKIVAQPNGEITVSMLKAPGGALERWREVEPFVWQRVNGVERVAAVVKDGKVTTFGIEGYPFMVFHPATGGYAPWNAILLPATLAVLALTVVLWPVTAIVRWRYRHPFGLSGNSATLYRLVRVAAIAGLALAGGWLLLLSKLESDIALLTDAINPWLRVLQGLALVCVAGGVVGVLNLLQVWRDKDRSWWAKLSSLILAVATVAAVWFIIDLHLVTASLNF